MRTEIVALLDRSGSMVSIADDMKGGFNQFVEDQRRIEGPCRLTLCQFDTEYEVVYERKKLKHVPPLVLEPRGWTALHDAIGKTIGATELRLAAIEPEKYPDKVIVVIVTDGMENSSVEHSAESVRALVEAHRDWEFVYLGANQDAIAVGRKYGMRGASTMSYAATGQGVGAAMASVSRGVLESRTETTAGVVFNADDRAAQREQGAVESSVDEGGSASASADTR